MKTIIFSLWFIVYGLLPFVYAQDETLTLLTYYPAPYGMYNRIGIGVDIQFLDPGESRTLLKIQDEARLRSSGTALLAVGKTTDSKNSAIFAFQPGIAGEEAYGIATRIISDVGQTGPITALYGNAIGSAQSGDITGLYAYADNAMPGASTNCYGGNFYAHHNTTGGSYGLYVSAENSGPGEVHGLYTTVSSKATSTSGKIFGQTIESSISDSNNNAAIYGLSVLASSPGTGAVYGIYSEVEGSEAVNRWAGWFVGKVKFAAGIDEEKLDINYIYDVAELIPCADDVEYGDVVVISPDKDREVMRCTKENQIIAGIISENPTVSFGDRERVRELEPEKNWNFLALAGQVYCNVDASYGEINRGDLLTTSPTPGYAMKAVNPKIGTIVGKALQPMKDGKGRILVLVSPM